LKNLLKKNVNYIGIDLAFGDDLENGSSSWTVFFFSPFLI